MAGQLINRGPDTWQIRVYLGRDSATGKKLFHTRTIHGGKRQAEKELRRALADRDAGTLAVSARMSFDAYLKKWLEASVGGPQGATTLYFYGEVMRRYAVPYFGKMRLEQIRALDVQAWIGKLTAQGLAGGTIRQATTILGVAFQQAVRWGMLAVNPVRNTVRPSGKRQVKIRVFDEVEARRFLEAAQGHHLGLLFEVALVTGMRPEEYLGLTWPDIDWREGRIRVEKVLVRDRARAGEGTGSRGWFHKEPKTKSSKRTIDVPPALIERLRRHQVGQKADQEAAGDRYEKNHLVFADRFGRPSPSPEYLGKKFREILSRAGISGPMRAYDLRHTCATLLLRAGENVKVVSERLGHASVAITLDTYAQVLPSMQEQASKKLDGLLYGTMEA